jgi:AraC-like DNA-binding protein
MGLVVDTDAVSPSERLSLWQAASSEALMPLSIRCSGALQFSGRIAGYDLGAVRIFRIESSPSLVLRTREGVRDRDPEWLQLAIHLRGETVVRQGDHATALRVGDCICLDSSRPFTIDNLEFVEWLVFDMPKQLLGSQRDRICRQTASRLPRDHGVATLAAPFLCQLGKGLDSGAVRDHDLNLGEAVLGLIRALLTSPEDSGGTSNGRRAALLLEVKAFIEANLANPNLGPEEVARAHFISTRQLSRLFEAEGLSACEWIRERRLDRCRRDLGDPALADERVFAIATRWGFRNQAHFSRLFRAAYGCAPREYRRDLQP